MNNSNQLDMARKHGAESNLYRHGKTGHPLWRIWRGMIGRCHVKSNGNYKNYGGKGITVCERWKVFENFFFDMSPNWNEGLEIDRINNLLGYTSENCRWATRREQCNNINRNVRIELSGETHTISEWSQLLNIKTRTISARIRVLGWTPQQALSLSFGRNSKSNVLRRN